MEEHNLILPGTQYYNPYMPWVYKVTIRYNEIAVDLYFYIDDGRSTTSSARNDWKSTQKV